MIQCGKKVEEWVVCNSRRCHFVVIKKSAMHMAQL